MDLRAAAALAYAGLCAGVVLFQIALIAGAPWGAYTQGGRHAGRLPAGARLAAAVSVLVLLGMAGGVLSAAGLHPRWPAWAGWGALGLSGLALVLNWITPSRPERLLWGPVTAAMLALSLVVLFG